MSENIKRDIRLPDNKIDSQNELNRMMNLNETSNTGKSYLKYGMEFNNDTANNFLDYKLFEYTIQNFMKIAFRWNGLEKKEARLVETLLFRNGKVAITEILGEKVISNFNYDEKDLDIYGYPSKIVLVNDRKHLDNKKIGKGKFIIIHNNTEGKPTFIYLWDRLRSMLLALQDVDNANLLSTNFLVMDGKVDDDTYKSFLNAINNKEVLIRGSNSFGSDNLQEINFNDLSPNKQNNFTFQLNLILKFLGLKASETLDKAERTSELEVAVSDTFKGFLLESMLESRQENLEGTQITVSLNEVLNEKPEMNQPDKIKDMKGDDDENTGE